MLDVILGSRCAGCGTRGCSTPCGACLDQLVAAAPVTGAGWWHTGVAARLVLAAKYGTWRSGGCVLARLLVATERISMQHIDIVTWVPADRRRRARRGGCLPERTARELARLVGVPAAPMLVRRRASASQRGRTRSERLRNASTGYSLRGRSLLERSGAHVLVVDDVRTTGATLQACSHLLADTGMVPTTFAIVASAAHCGKSAASEEFTLTNSSADADMVGHDERNGALDP